MIDLFIRCRDIASCPRTIWEFGNIWENVATENCVTQLWLMTKPSVVQPISH